MSNVWSCFRPKGRRCISRYYVGSSEAHSRHGKEPENDVTFKFLYKSLNEYELSKPLKTRHSPQLIGSVGKSSDVDSDSNHGEQICKSITIYIDDTCSCCRLFRCARGVIPNFGRGKLISYDQIISDDKNASRSGRILSLRMRSGTMDNQEIELIYEATLRRAVLYGIHIQGTVIGNHIAWEPRCPFGEDLVGI